MAQIVNSFLSPKASINDFSVSPKQGEETQNQIIIYHSVIKYIPLLFSLNERSNK